MERSDSFSFNEIRSRFRVSLSLSAVCDATFVRRFSSCSEQLLHSVCACTKYVIGILTTTSLHNPTGQNRIPRPMPAYRSCQRNATYIFVHVSGCVCLTRTKCTSHFVSRKLCKWPMYASFRTLYRCRTVDCRLLLLLAEHRVSQKCRYGWGEFIERRRRIQCAFPLE